MKKMFFIIFVFLFSSIFAQEIGVVEFYSIGDETNAFTSVPEPEIYASKSILGRVSNSLLTVDYSANVPQEAITAFDKAVDIIKNLISISKEVKLKVDYKSLTGTTLGQGRVVTYRNHVSGATFQDVQYSIALAMQLDQTISYSGYSGEIDFNSSTDWNFQTDGIPIENEYDFLTIALHEIIHTLGFIGTIRHTGSNAYFGISGFATESNTAYPTIYEKFLVSGTQKLLDIENNTELAAVLQGGNVSFDGANAKKANSNTAPKLYAPSTWESGSSIFHLDETEYSAGTSQSLMTPKISMAEVNHNPGSIVLGMLKDLGWPVGNYILFTNIASSANIIRGQEFTIKWYDNFSVNEYYDFVLYKYTGDQSLEIMTINSSPVTSTKGNNQWVWNVPTTLTQGTYYIVAESYNSSFKEGISKKFVISDKLSEPYFTPSAGHYDSPQFINIVSGTPGATIHYSLNMESLPSITSPEFIDGQPIWVPSNKTILAKAFLELPSHEIVSSDVARADYVVSETNNFVYIDNYAFGAIRKNGNQYADGASIQVGRTDSYVYRSYLSWRNIKNYIPANSVITSVELIIPFTPYIEEQIEFREVTFTNLDKISKYNAIKDGELLNRLTRNDENKYQSNDLVLKIDNIVNHGATDQLIIGLKGYDEDNKHTSLISQSTTVALKIYYGDNTQVNQTDINGDPFGQVGSWETSGWVSKYVPFSFNAVNNVKLKASQDYKTGTTQKFHNWKNQNSYLNFESFNINNNEINFFTAEFKQAEQGIIIKNYLENSNLTNYVNDKIYFSDPWLIDKYETPYGFKNQGIAAIPLQKESPFIIAENAAYQDVFTGEVQDSQDPTKPFYKVKTESPQTISVNGTNHTFYFQNWAAYPIGSASFKNANALETPIVFYSAGAEVRAVMKGTGFSDDDSAISYPGQRKIVQIDNGKLYRVYSSMDQVWLESSTDGGSSWTFQVLNNGERAKNVSITRYLNTVLVAYQIEGISEYSNINIDQFRGENGVLISTESVSGVDIPVSYSSNLFPIIEASFAQLNQGTFLIAWKQSDGLYYKNGASDIYSGLWWNHDPQKVNGTTSSSSYPTMAVLKGVGYPKSYHLAYQEGTQQIRYIKINEDYQHTITFSSVETPSYGSGFSYNKSPSIIVIDNNDPRVAWMGYNLSSANKTGLNKELIPEDAHRAVLRAKSGSTWSSTFFMG